MEVVPGITQIGSTGVFCYLIKEKDGLTLIDTGLPGTHKAILRHAATVSCDAADIHRVFITHADGDHYGSLNALQAVTNATTYASPVEAESIQAGKASRALRGKGIESLVFALVAPLFKAKPAGVDMLVAGEEEFPIMGGLRVLETPGHTPAHISYYLPHLDLIFSGDSIILKHGRLAPSQGGNTWDSNLATRSFEQQMALNPRILCGGHILWKQ